MFAAGERVRRRFAEEIGLARFNRLEPVGGGDRNVDDIQFAEIELGAQIRYDSSAQVDYETCRLSIGAFERERGSSSRTARRMVLSWRSFSMVPAEAAATPNTAIPDQTPNVRRFQANRGAITSALFRVCALAAIRCYQRFCSQAKRLERRAKWRRRTVWARTARDHVRDDERARGTVIG